MRKASFMVSTSSSTELLLAWTSESPHPWVAGPSQDRRPRPIDRARTIGCPPLRGAALRQDGNARGRDTSPRCGRRSSRGTTRTPDSHGRKTGRRGSRSPGGTSAGKVRWYPVAHHRRAVGRIASHRSPAHMQPVVHAQLHLRAELTERQFRQVFRVLVLRLPDQEIGVIALVAFSPRSHSVYSSSSTATQAGGTEQPSGLSK